MHHPVVFDPGRLQAQVVLSRTGLHLPLVLQQAGQRQTGLVAPGRQLDGLAITNHGLLVHALLAAQVPGFEPAAVIARESLEQLRKTIARGHVVTLHDQTARPLQGGGLQPGVFLQRFFVGGTRLCPLPGLEVGIALVVSLGGGRTHFTNGGHGLGVGRFGLNGIHVGLSGNKVRLCRFFYYKKQQFHDLRTEIYKQSEADSARIDRRRRVSTGLNSKSFCFSTETPKP